jgi:ferredoxin
MIGNFFRNYRQIPILFINTRNFSNVKITYTFADGSEKTCEAKSGTSILDIAHANNVELEGACEGSLACSTCHVILRQEDFDKLLPPTEEENDMLDLAFGLTETSRLGCQVKVTEELSGIRVKIPAITRNVAVDGYKPPLH